MFSPGICCLLSPLSASYQFCSVRSALWVRRPSERPLQWGVFFRQHYMLFRQSDFCLFCRAEVTPWPSLCGGSGAPGGPRPTELCVRCRRSNMSGPQSKMTGWLLSATGPCMHTCVSMGVREWVCFACSNVLSWVTLRPGGRVFQIVSCGCLGFLQQEHILANLMWHVEHSPSGLKCVLDVL